MNKIVLVALSAMLLFCACSSRYERGGRLMENASHPRNQYYWEFANGVKDPVSFAKEILRGDYDQEIKEW